MESIMDKQEIVESYLEDYFGHDLFETLTNEEIAEAIVAANLLANSLNEFFQIDEKIQKRETSTEYIDHHVGGILSPSDEVAALNRIAIHLAGNFTRRSAIEKEDR